MKAIDVSPEMLTLVGVGDLGDHRWPQSPVAFEFDFVTPSSVRFHSNPVKAALERDGNAGLIFLVARDACERLLGQSLDIVDGEVFLLPAALRGIAQTIRDCVLPEPVAVPYRLAKSIELLCELLSAHGAGELAPACGSGTLSQLDMKRIAAARQIIDEQWHEKLTLCQIARCCGLNRNKLSRGFRELYHCTVAQALAERRLAEASRQLIATDLPVSLIGYRSGYLNNAAFTRAFGRRYGQSPSHFRACGVAA